MSIQNITDSVEPIYRQWYDSVYEDLSYRDHPLMGLVRKEAQYGETIKVPLKYAPNAGRSASFSTAQTNIADLSRIAFLVNPGKDYSLSKVQNTDIELTGNDRGAVMSALMDATETNHNNLADSLERDLFGSGYGTLGSIATGGITSATITLANREQAVNFYKNQKIVWCSTEAGASLRNSGAVGTVLSVDLDAGTVVFTATISSIGNAIAPGDFMFQQGDKTDATKVKLVGLRGWIPLTAPSPSESFFGVDRSANPTLLAGWRYDGRQLKLTEAINRGVTRIGTLAGSKPDVVMMSPATFETFLNLLDSKAVYVDVQGKDISVGYTGIRWMSSKGPLTVHQSPFCDYDRFYILSTKSWKLGAPKNEPIMVANKNKYVDVYNDDAIEIRERTLAFFSCFAPGFNAVCQIA